MFPFVSTVPMPFAFKISPLLLAGTIVVVLGLICDAIIIARFLPAPNYRVPPKPWGGRVLLISLLMLAGLIVLANGCYALLATLQHTKNVFKLAAIVLPAELLLRVGVLVGFVMYFRKCRIRLQPALGLDAMPLGVAAGWGVLFCLASLPPVEAIIFATNAFCRLFHIAIADQPIIDLFLNIHSPALLITLLIFAISVAPVFEEFLFRGFAYPVLKQRLGLGPAWLLVAAVFALSHWHAPSFLPLFVFALGLGLAYELTGSLVAPITMHALFNATMILQIFYQRSHP